MEASVVDLRYNTARILGALEHNETVTLLYHGKPKGVILPITRASAGAGATASASGDGKPRRRKASEHPFFGMHKDDTRRVEEVMNALRAPRSV
jgi:antitoxin (DNA-binding transcriptional repressor) of toxin-antitoxin stability system